MKLYIVSIAEFNDLSGYYLLPLARQQKIDKYRFKTDKIRSLLSGLLLRYHFKDLANHVQEDAYGKPYIKNSLESFNLSHSGKYVCLVVDKTNVGVDVEQIETFSVLVKQKCFTQNEIDYVEKNANKEEACFKIWTRKESILKCLGAGLRISPSSFDVIDCDNEQLVINDNRLFVHSFVYDNHVFTICSKASIDIEQIVLNKNALLR